MGVLDQVLQYKRQREAQQAMDIQSIPNALTAYQQGQQLTLDNERNAKKDLIDEMTTKISAAKAGLAIDTATGEIKKDDSLKNPLDEFLEMGKVAGASKNIYDAGGPDLLGEFLNPNGLSTFNSLNQNTITQPTPNISNSASQQSSSVTTKPGDIIPKGYDRHGRPTGYEVIKQTESEKKRDVETNELSSGLNSMVELFRTAQSQRDSKTGSLPLSENLPKGSQEKLRGKAAKLGASIGLDKLDAVDAYSRKRKTFATVLAKAAGEQRPTDEDVNRFMESLPDVGLPDATNERLIEALVNDLNARGAKEVWIERIKSKNQDSTQYSKEQESLISENMKAYGKSRDEIVKAMKKRGVI